MSESVKILIEADDQASAKLVALNRQAENTAKAFKASGERMKASTEVFGTLANLAGGNVLGSIAGQFAQLTEKTGQFADKSKDAGAAMAAMRVGAIGIAAGAGYQLGQVIGEWALQADKVRESLARMKTEFDKLNSGMMDNHKFQMDLKNDLASSLPTYDEQVAALKKLQVEQAKYTAAQELLVAQQAVAVAESETRDANPLARLGMMRSNTPAEQAQLDVLKASLEAYEAMDKSLKQQLETLKAKHEQEVRIAEQLRKQKDYDDELASSIQKEQAGAAALQAAWDAANKERQKLTQGQEANDIANILSTTSATLEEAKTLAAFMAKTRNTADQAEEMRRKEGEEIQKKIDDLEKQKEVAKFVAGPNTAQDERFLKGPKGEAGPELKKLSEIATLQKQLLEEQRKLSKKEVHLVLAGGGP